MKYKPVMLHVQFRSRGIPDMVCKTTVFVIPCHVHFHTLNSSNVACASMSLQLCHTVANILVAMEQCSHAARRLGKQARQLPCCLPSCTAAGLQTCSSWQPQHCQTIMPVQHQNRHNHNVWERRRSTAPIQVQPALMIAGRRQCCCLPPMMALSLCGI